MVQFQLQFQNLILEDIKDENADFFHGPKISIAITFDKGSISHQEPISNTRIHVQMKGAFLLCLPLGEYPKMEAYDGTKLDEMLKKMALEYFVQEYDTSLGQLSLYPSSCLFQLAPTLKPWNKKSELFIKTVFVFWCMDDFFARAFVSSMPLLVHENFTDFIRFFVNIMSGLYRETSSIPNTDVPFLNSILRAWFSIYVELKGQVTGYEKYHHDFLKEVLNWVRNYKISALYMGADWAPTNQPYTMLKRLGGRKVILELFQLLTATYVDEYIREHTLFQMFRESADLICNLVYDVVSLTRVATSKQLCKNSLLSEITKWGLTFDSALEKHLLVINNEILDLQRAAKGLAQEFSGAEAVEKYVRNTMLHVDGTIRYLLSQDRYGKCDCKVMKVLSIAHLRI